MRARPVFTLLACAAICVPALAGGQSEPLEVAGTWQVDTPDGPQTVIIRADSTASFGEETVKWRITADTMFILFGDEWIGYNVRLDGESLTFSGGDLEEPITLKRTGPPTPGDGPPERAKRPQRGDPRS